jgi:excisionase family DNA binding protein
MASSIVDILLGTQHLLSVGEAAEIIGTCTETIRRWAKAGKLPVFRLAGGWRIDPKVLADFLEARRTA